MKPATDTPLERYIRALESIALSQDGLGVSGLADRCGLSVATAHRLLQNLQATGLIVTAGGKRKDYKIGPRLLRILHASSDSAWLAIAVQPVLNALADRLSETCYLARLLGDEVVSVAWAAPSSGLRGYVVPGLALAPHVAASAKAIMAFQAPDMINRVLSAPLAKLTPETRTERVEIEQDYAGVRNRGYATCWNEMEQGLGALAVPIPLAGVGVLYSVGTAGLLERMTKKPEQDYVQALRSAVEPLTLALKGRPPEVQAASGGRTAP